MSQIQGVRKNITEKGVCRHCGGYGKRLKPHKDKKFPNFVRCGHCGGNGVRFKAKSLTKKL